MYSVSPNLLLWTTEYYGIGGMHDRHQKAVWVRLKAPEDLQLVSFTKNCINQNLFYIVTIDGLASENSYW